MSVALKKTAVKSAKAPRPQPTLVRSLAPQTRNYPLIRLSCGAVALVLGAIQAWITRFAMAPDGISYLDMGNAYWSGDWHNAINAYWSPLYAWILGIVVNTAKPDVYHEFPLVHLVNFLVYAGTLLCFDFFLKNFISAARVKATEEDGHVSLGLSESSWWILGYALFTSTSLLLVGLFRVCPDMCVAALVYLASGLIVRIRTGNNNVSTYLLLGLVLGLSYLAKAVMFPLGFVFVAVAIAPSASFKANLKNRAIALVVFLLVCSPLFLATSKHQGKLTFGESGSWNYALYVDGMRYWETSPSLKHPVRAILNSPPVFEFGEPIAGTFPPWYDPTYWHQGFVTRVALRASLRNVWQAAGVYAGIFFLPLASMMLGAGLLIAGSHGGPIQSIRRSARWWPIAIPAIATLAIYAPVHVEGRFIAASVSVLLLAAYAGVRAQSPARAALIRRTVWVVSALALAMVLVAPKVLWPVSNLIYAYPDPVPGPAEAAAAAALLRSGVNPQDKIGLIWNEKWAHGAVQGAFMAHLARVKIVCEEIDADAFWNFDAAARQRAIAALQSVGIRAIVAKNVPAPYQQGWHRLGNTEYFMYPGTRP
jgi:hypothetical protein